MERYYLKIKNIEDIDNQKQLSDDALDIVFLPMFAPNKAKLGTEK